jgi:DNA-binding Lrp family transcriptional regulator
MSVDKMDDLDKDLIHMLQKDARMKFTKIAEELKQPDTTIHFRTRKLLENNTVSRFSALVVPEALGFTTAAILRIEIGGHIIPDISKDYSTNFAQKLAKDEQYLWVAVDKEPMTVFALVMGTDDADLEQRAEKLRGNPDVVNITMTQVGKVLKGWEISQLGNL